MSDDKMTELSAEDLDMAVGGAGKAQVAGAKGEQKIKAEQNRKSPDAKDEERRKMSAPDLMKEELKK
ncbi:MAG: hypothetical protein AAGD13_20805 [Pseudomonadota bacterium]